MDIGQATCQLALVSRYGFHVYNDHVYNCIPTGTQLCVGVYFDVWMLIDGLSST